MKVDSPLGPVEMPENEPMYSINCKSCGETIGGGFLVGTWTLEKARSFAEQHSACPYCGGKGGDIVYPVD